jgi:hypothetical protein
MYTVLLDVICESGIGLAYIDSDGDSGGGSGDVKKQCRCIVRFMYGAKPGERSCRSCQGQPDSARSGVYFLM